MWAAVEVLDVARLVGDRQRLPQMGDPLVESVEVGEIDAERVADMTFVSPGIDSNGDRQRLLTDTDRAAVVAEEHEDLTEPSEGSGTLR